MNAVPAVLNTRSQPCCAPPDTNGEVGKVQYLQMVRRGDHRSTAITCAEAVCWRCHRSLIADYLKARGVEVLHILGANKVGPHPYTSAARIVNGELSYAADSLL